MRSKKRGNTIIEIIVAVNIILMMFLIVAMLIASNRANYYKRGRLEDGSRIVYCIMQEIKYNMSIDEIMGEKEVEYISLKYDEEFLKNLTIKSLMSMESGSDIVISINKKSDNEEVLEVKIKFYIENDIDILEKSFLKYQWMEYYE